MDTPLNILVTDDHALIREGLKFTLQYAIEGAVVLEAEDARKALHCIENHPEIEVVLLDLFLPDTNGFDLLRILSDKYPDKPVIILSSSEEISDMRKAIDLGAAGFISKSSSNEIMLSALKLVLSGGVYIPPEMLRRDSKCPAGQVEHLSPSRLNGLGLTDRQVEVLRLLGHGMCNKNIASELGVSQNTVKIHVTAVLKSLGVANRAQAGLAAQKLGLTDGSAESA